MKSKFATEFQCHDFGKGGAGGHIWPAEYDQMIYCLLHRNVLVDVKIQPEPNGKIIQ